MFFDRFTENSLFEVHLQRTASLLKNRNMEITKTAELKNAFLQVMKKI